MNIRTSCDRTLQLRLHEINNYNNNRTGKTYFNCIFLYRPKISINLPSTWHSEHMGILCYLSDKRKLRMIYHISNLWQMLFVKYKSCTIFLFRFWITQQEQHISNLCTYYYRPNISIFMQSTFHSEHMGMLNFQINYQRFLEILNIRTGFDCTIYSLRIQILAYLCHQLSYLSIWRYYVRGILYHPNISITMMCMLYLPLPYAYCLLAALYTIFHMVTLAYLCHQLSSLSIWGYYVTCLKRFNWG